MGFKKSILGRAWVAKTPPNIEANLGSQKSIFEAQVGFHLGGGGEGGLLAALGPHRAFFWRPKLNSSLGGAKLATDPFYY